MSKLTYTKVGDYYLPNLKMNKNKQFSIGRYGLKHLNYIKEYKKSLYIDLITSEKLNEYLHNIDLECNNQYELLIKQMMINENITEDLKAENQMLWVQKMNAIRNSVEEIINNEYIYN